MNSIDALADHASHPNDVVSWDEVKASLDERLKKSPCGLRFSTQRVVIFEDATVWYEERRSGLSAEFRAELDAAVALAAE